MINPFERSRWRNVYEKVVADIRRRPLLNFFLALVLLFLVMFLVHVLQAPKNIQAQNPAPKSVKLYHIGNAPTITLSAKIEKSGVINIVAQTAGVVQSINVTEGDSVNRGTTLINLSSNYQGGDAPAVQAQIAQVQANNTNQTYGTQLDVLHKQRDIATTSAQNTEDLRAISAKSVDETQSLINQNQDILTSLNQSINDLQAAPSNSTTQQTIIQTKQLRAQLQSGINQLQQALRATQFQTDTNNPPTQLANLQKDITLKQLDIQEKMLTLGKDVSNLQANLANINASLMHPASPVAGTVERVNIHIGQTVTPGTPLATIMAGDPDVTAVVAVPSQIAASASRIQPSTLHIGNIPYTTTPRYVTTEATEGSSYAILYSIPQELQSAVTNAGYITIDVPVGIPDTGSVVPFVPIDSVYQTQNDAYVYIIKKNTVASRKVTLDSVYGDYVAVTSGLNAGDEIILDRNVTAGDKVIGRK